MNDILPPKRPLSQDKRAANTPPRVDISPQKALDAPEPEVLLEPPQTPLLLDKPRKSAKKIVLWCFGVLIVLIVAFAATAYAWYVMALAPVNSQNSEKTRVEIVEGSSPSDIGDLLEEKQLIKSSFAFDLYTRLSGTRSQLQAGTYSLMQSESTEQIVRHLVSGNVDEFSITFLPGATLADNRKGLIKAGYSEAEVDAALKKTYDHPLFASKPSTADLEGYVYGETYSFSADATVEEVLVRTFDEFYAKIQANDLIAGFEKQGLNLYEGITLASIIQREVPEAGDQKQVAQVFFKRLKMDMQLGSDVTAYYGADKIGVSRSVGVDTPYNTRIHKGLPPGPIGTPGLTALQAVAAPASGNYVYFLSGDDEVTYFAVTNDEHEENIKNHCQVKCSIP
jgi:UPF0755 protein